ncbi:MAG TPA: hypothetical protein VFC07_11390 [Verrucomicrobiae bacterium]|nr:hypothetical protein [Verrucomicrobiae bacterium]
MFRIDFNPHNGKGRVTADVSKEKVKQLYQAVLHFFPHTTQFQSLCDDLAGQPFSGIYWGEPDINCISSYLARYALYTSHIIVTNPFCDSLIYLSEKSPLLKPEAWVQVTMNQALFLVSIEPWIKENIISVLPHPGWFQEEAEAFNQLMEATEKRINGYDVSTRKKLGFETIMKHLKTFRPEHVEAFVKQIFGGSTTPEVIRAAKGIAEIEYKRNPIRYAWDVPVEGLSTFTKVGAGHSLESVSVTAHLTGSYLLFGEDFYRLQYDLATKDGKGEAQNSMNDLSRAFAALDFQFLNAVSLDFALGLRKEGKLATFRQWLINVWDKISSRDYPNRANLYGSLKDELHGQYANYKTEWSSVDKALVQNLAKVVVGTGTTILTGQIGFKIAAGGMAALGFNELLGAFSKRRDLKRLPLGVFLSLEKKP